MYFAFLLVFLAAGLAAFVVFARKGRRFRKQPLPPVANKAFLEWNDDEKRVEITTPFYFGRSEKSDVVLPSARVEFEVCIFSHNNRFAFQTLDGAGEVQVNGQEMIASYLQDGDRLQIAGQEFILRMNYS